MTIGMLSWVIAVGGACAASGWALARVARRFAREERWIWVGALAGVVVASWVPIVPEVAPVVVATFTVTGVPAGPSWLDAIAGVTVPGFGRVWLGLGGLVLGAVVLDELRNRRMRARMPEARVRGVAVRMDAAHGPAVSGLVRPTLVLPPRFRDLDPGRRRALLTHEVEHLRAGDVRLVAGVWLLIALAPWNPWAWLLAHRVLLAVEADCDRRTLRRRRTTPRVYAELLLEVAGWCAGRGASTGRVARPARRARLIELSMGRDARRLTARLDLLLSDRRRSRVLPAVLLLALVAVASPSLADPPRVQAERAAPAGRLTPMGTIRAGPDTFRAVEIAPGGVISERPTDRPVGATATYRAIEGNPNGN